jgi:hypothetical protein
MLKIEDKFSKDQKKRKEVNVGLQISKGKLTFGANAKVEINSSNIKNYKYVCKENCITTKEDKKKKK